MNTLRRSGNKWTVNELLQLQRNYELLEMSVQEIAIKHQRSVEAILFKLEAESFIDRWCNARGYNNLYSDTYDIVKPSVTSYDEEESNSDSEEDQMCDDSMYEDEDEDEDEDDEDQDNLSDRVYNLETSVNQINSMVRQMFENMRSQKQTKRAPLRKQHATCDY